MGAISIFYEPSITSISITRLARPEMQVRLNERPVLSVVVTPPKPFITAFGIDVHTESDSRFQYQ